MRGQFWHCAGQAGHLIVVKGVGGEILSSGESKRSSRDDKARNFSDLTKFHVRIHVAPTIDLSQHYHISLMKESKPDEKRFRCAYYGLTSEVPALSTTLFPPRSRGPS